MGSVIFYFLASLFIIEPIIKVWFPNQTFSIPYIYGIIGTILCGIQFYHKRLGKISLTDILIFILLIINISNILKYNHLPLIVLITIIYLLSKTLPDKPKITYILIGSGVLQAIIMIMQWSRLLPVDSIISITGSFNNSGSLGGYLAICFIACIGSHKYINRYLYLICNLILVGALIISDSRAAWLGVLFTLLYMGIKSIHVNQVKQILSFAILISVFAVFSLTIYKTDSAKGRLAIWKISTKMIIANPVVGNGLMSFRRDYMRYQADYLNEHPEAEEQMLLSNNGFAFNEFIRIFYEQGFIGLLIALIILAKFIRESNRQNSPYYLCFISFIVFSCFSYPFEVFLLVLLVAMLTGALSENNPLVITKKSLYLRRIILSIFCIFTIAITGWQWKKKVQIENALTYYLYRNDIDSFNYIQRHYNEIKYSTNFILRYARILYLKGEYHAAIPVIEQAIHLYPTTDKYCELGNIYQSIFLYKKAEKAYNEAIYLLPKRIYPHYCLFLLYKETGQKNKAIEKAYDIINISPKKVNQRYIEIKSDVENFIQIIINNINSKQYEEFDI